MLPTSPIPNAPVHSPKMADEKERKKEGRKIYIQYQPLRLKVETGVGERRLGEEE